jgi:hypothetical protein
MAYNGLISYSHTADGALAAAIQSALHSFEKPGKHAAPTDLRTSTCSLTSPALHLARMASASPSPRDRPPLVIPGANCRPQLPNLHDVEIQGAPVIDKLFFLDPSEVFAQWSNKLFHITIDPPSVTSLPGLPGEMRVDPSGKALAVQRDGTRPLLVPTAVICYRSTTNTPQRFGCGVQAICETRPAPVSPATCLMMNGIVGSQAALSTNLSQLACSELNHPRAGVQEKCSSLDERLAYSHFGFSIIKS